MTLRAIELAGVAQQLNWYLGFYNFLCDFDTSDMVTLQSIGTSETDSTRQHHSFGTWTGRFPPVAGLERNGTFRIETTSFFQRL